MERMLPQNIEAEQGVLGSILIDPDAVDVVAEKLQPCDFYRDAHRAIYEAMMRLHSQDIPPDFMTLCDELERYHRLADIGGDSYLSSLINCVPTSGNVGYYTRIVAEHSQMRSAIHAAGQIVAEAYADGATIGDVLAKAERLYSEIALRTFRGNGFAGMGELIPTQIERLDYLHRHRGTIIGVPTGFTNLDRMTGGLQRSDLIVLAARPGIGKTSMALCIGCNAALKYKQKVAVFSCEMSKEQLVLRATSMLAGVDQQRLRTGWIEDDEWTRIVDAGDRLADSSLWIDDTPGITPMEMRNKAKRLQSERGLDLVIVDYMQLMQAGNTGKKYENRVQEVSEISRSLKGLARELDVPVLALSQLSRSVEGRQNKVPQLSDLRESGAIEQDADIVAFIYRDEIYNPETERKNIADLIVAKHRNGPVGAIPFHFDPTQTRFADLEG